MRRRVHNRRKALVRWRRTQMPRVRPNASGDRSSGQPLDPKAHFDTLQGLSPGRVILEPLTWQARDAVKLWLGDHAVLLGDLDGPDTQGIQLRPEAAARLLEQFSTNWR